VGHARGTKKTSYLAGVPIKRTPDKWDFSKKCPTYRGFSETCVFFLEMQTFECDFEKKFELQTFDSSDNHTRVPLKRAFLLRGHKKMVLLSGGPTYPWSQLSGIFSLSK